MAQRQFGIIGFPLGHSFSRAFFGDKFERERLDAEYLNFEIPSISDLPLVLERHPHLEGFNVTIPYKLQVIPYLDELSPEARAIGAVNLVKITYPAGDRRLTGYNVDVTGFTLSLKPLLRPCHRRALVLGTGGASHAVAYGLRSLSIEPLIVSRTPHNDRIGYPDLDESVLRDHLVIVNCTPLGMYPHVDACPDLPYQLLTPDHILYDLVYNPSETLFLRKGKQYGATTKNGLEMLRLQALAGWDIWNTPAL